MMVTMSKVKTVIHLEEKNHKEIFQKKAYFSVEFQQMLMKIILKKFLDVEDKLLLVNLMEDLKLSFIWIEDLLKVNV